MSPERIKINEEWIPEFAKLIPLGSLVYDIGKGSYNYQDWLLGRTVKTIDRDNNVNPDYCLDIEKDVYSIPRAQGVICIGITEQCDNPFDLIKTIPFLLEPKGKVFFSVLLTGYPLIATDYFRFTSKGAWKALDKYFNNIGYGEMTRGGIPSCLFYLGEKK